jgi:epoxide hydrolase-like predicted phosphatase
MKAIIFDCFGVLTADGWKQLREEFFADDPERMQHSIDIDKAVNAGYMGYDEFIREIAHMTKLREAEVRSRLNGSVPNRMLFDYIRDELKPHYKIGMLSNAADNWLDKLFEPWQVQLFDEVMLSYQVGMVKPDPAMYQMIANRLGVLPADCVFVDDSERYVVAAADLGMQAIYHQDTPATIARIKELLHA